MLFDDRNALRPAYEAAIDAIDESLRAMAPFVPAFAAPSRNDQPVRERRLPVLLTVGLGVAVLAGAVTYRVLPGEAHAVQAAR